MVPGDSNATPNMPSTWFSEDVGVVGKYFPKEHGYLGIRWSSFTLSLGLY